MGGADTLGSEVAPRVQFLQPRLHVMNLVRLASSALALSSLVALASAQAVLHTVQGAATPASAGHALVFTPDVDGDGVPDFAVGSPLEAPAGFVRVHSGRDGSVLRSFEGATPGAQFGFALAIVNDLDGAGIADLMIGAPGTTWSHSNQGTAYVYSLETGVRWAQIFGSGTNSRMGYSVANLGDIDGDGVDDFGAGEPGADFGALVDNGAVVMVSGASAQFLPVVRGAASGEQFGLSLSGWGDLDGDGDDEWLVGAPFNATFGAGAGRVAIVDGGAHSVLWSCYGGQAGEHFGLALASLADSDGDGVLDFAVGAPESFGSAANQGRVARFSGLSVAPQEERLGAPGERLGRALALCDFDGDGVRELAAGAPQHVAGALGRVGAVHVLDALTLAPETTLVGSSSDGEFGAALSGGVDLNGDGAHELGVGARAELAQRGVARVLAGATPQAATYCAAKTTSNGCTPRMRAEGCASLSTGAGLTARVFGATQNAPGMLFWGLAPNAAPLRGGTLCVASPLRRTPLQLASVGAAGCSGALAFTFTPALLQATDLSAGEQVHAQFWWRDNGFAAPNNVGLSDAVVFVVAP